MIDRTAQTVREKVDKALFSKGTSTGDTAELSIDDLGLDADSLDQGRALEDTHFARQGHDRRRASVAR